MNHLAHLWLAPPAALPRVGNLLGDFAAGLDLDALPDPVRRGVEQHRAVDRFTDAHPVFRRSRARVAPPLARWSGVLVDVFYDHFLARDWHLHGDGRPLDAFTQEVYAQLLQHRPLLPERLRAALPRMIDNDWLAISRTRDGVRLVLERLRRRLRRDAPLDDGVDDLTRHYDAFAADFEAFAPELRTFAIDR
ncbi:MAG: ACP phosphodiesterase [Planctomycetota bacterium]